MTSWTLRHPLSENHWWVPVFSVVEYLLDGMKTKELSAITEEPAYYSVGPVSGLARTKYCLAAVTNTYPALSLAPQLVEQLLSPFETVRPGTEVFFHNMKGPWPQWLDQKGSYPTTPLERWQCSIEYPSTQSA